MALNRFIRKPPRLRLEPEAYRQLSRHVLARDRWRCQDCGTAQNLQVRHLRWRSRLGDDVEENPITLCADCHRARHIRRRPTIVQIKGAVIRTKTELQSRGQKRCHEELTYRKFNRPRCHCSRPPVRIEQRFPKPRVGSSTLPRPTTLILSFSSSSTIPSIRWNAPK